MNAIATINDQFRKSWKDVMFTPGVLMNVTHHLGLAQAVHSYDDFNEDNDPWNEHDFGSFTFEGQKIFWKIDYYDQELKSWGDPLDDKCRRVITVMLAEDY